MYGLWYLGYLFIRHFLLHDATAPPLPLAGDALDNRLHLRTLVSQSYDMVRKKSR